MDEVRLYKALRVSPADQVPIVSFFFFFFLSLSFHSTFFSCHHHPTQTFLLFFIFPSYLSELLDLFTQYYWTPLRPSSNKQSKTQKGKEEEKTTCTHACSNSNASNAKPMAFALSHSSVPTSGTCDLQLRHQATLSSFKSRLNAFLLSKYFS